MHKDYEENASVPHLRSERTAAQKKPAKSVPKLDDAIKNRYNKRQQKENR